MNLLHKVALITTCSLILPLSAFAAGPTAINLGAAGNYTILAKTGISTTGTTAITGNMGVSPAAATYITGFALTLPATGAFATSALVNGKVYASDYANYANPTPSNLTAAVLDMQTAYTDAAGRAPTVTELGAGNIGGLTLSPGVYKWGTGVTIPTNVTLAGGANDVWIFQIAQNLNVSSGVHVILSGGAQASNVFWQVAGQTTIGTTAVFNGTILDQTAIVLNTGATLNGRALAQTAVTLDSNSVTIPSGSTPATPALPATPAIPAPSAISPALPATPAIPATSATPQTSSEGQMITLGNGQVVYVNSNGVFTNAQGYVVANTAVATSFSSASSASGTPIDTKISAIGSNLYRRDQGTAVATLQVFLISQNKGSAARALAKVGATSYFGEMTRAALAEFQASVGISPALGNFGPITRHYLASQ